MSHSATCLGLAGSENVYLATLEGLLAVEEGLRIRTSELVSEWRLLGLMSVIRKIVTRPFDGNGIISSQLGTPS